MYCPKCGKLITGDFQYCPNCGNKLTVDVSTSSSNQIIQENNTNISSNNPVTQESNNNMKINIKPKRKINITGIIVFIITTGLSAYFIISGNIVTRVIVILGLIVTLLTSKKSNMSNIAVLINVIIFLVGLGYLGMDIYSGYIKPGYGTWNCGTDSSYSEYTNTLILSTNQYVYGEYNNVSKDNYTGSYKLTKTTKKENGYQYYELELTNYRTGEEKIYEYGHSSVYGQSVLIDSSNNTIYYCKK